MTTQPRFEVFTGTVREVRYYHHFSLVIRLDSGRVVHSSFKRRHVFDEFTSRGPTAEERKQRVRVGDRVKVRFGGSDDTASAWDFADPIPQ